MLQHQLRKIGLLDPRGVSMRRPLLSVYSQICITVRPQVFQSAKFPTAGCFYGLLEIRHNKSKFVPSFSLIFNFLESSAVVR
jgi:hypothetical protein